MTPTNQIILSLKTEPDKWIQGDYTLTHENGTKIWTANLPYFNIGIYEPSRKISFIEKTRLQLAVNKWHKSTLIIGNRA